MQEIDWSGVEVMDIYNLYQKQPAIRGDNDLQRQIGQISYQLESTQLRASHPVFGLHRPTPANNSHSKGSAPDDYPLNNGYPHREFIFPL
jgi:hypothetical protein